VCSTPRHSCIQRSVRDQLHCGRDFLSVREQASAESIAHSRDNAGRTAIAARSDKFYRTQYTGGGCLSVALVLSPIRFVLIFRSRLQLILVCVHRGFPVLFILPR
jgi:hypothetical protein